MWQRCNHPHTPVSWCQQMATQTPERLTKKAKKTHKNRRPVSYIFLITFFNSCGRSESSNSCWAGSQFQRAKYNESPSSHHFDQCRPRNRPRCHGDDPQSQVTWLICMLTDVIIVNSELVDWICRSGALSSRSRESRVRQVLQSCRI